MASELRYSYQAMAGSLALPPIGHKVGNGHRVLEFDVHEPGQEERLKQLKGKDAKNVGVWYLEKKLC